MHTCGILIKTLTIGMVVCFTLWILCKATFNFETWMSLTGCLVTKSFGSLLLCGRALVKTQLIIILFKREAIKPPTKHIICDGCNNTPDTRHVYKHKLNIHILELMLKRLFHKLQIISIREIWNHVQALNRVGWLVNRFVKPYQQTIKHFNNTTVSHQSPVHCLICQAARQPTAHPLNPDKTSRILHQNKLDTFLPVWFGNWLQGFWWFSASLIQNQALSTKELYYTVR